MIQVTITDNGIRMEGHAGCRKEGHDIVCAAVSALTCNLINSLHLISQDKIQSETASGKTVIKWRKLSDSGKMLVASWRLGLQEINRQYHCIEFKMET